ncbi:MAG TPA: DUF4142 domain-containing protein [Bryobacteraceae bacterium]|nr:DUF4142 domain-containing protein [Bryobacteraceae bacterium]
MQHSVFVWILAGASLGLQPGLALAQRPGGGGAPMPAPRPDMNNPNSQPDMERSPRVDDRQFLKDAAMGGLLQVALGKLAVEKGSSDAVKQFGQKLIDDHTKVNDELKQAAAAGSVAVPDALDSKHQSRVDKLAKLSGAEFDKAYLKDQIKDHQQDIREFQREAEYGMQPQVKSLASKILPILQQHLELAKDLSKGKTTVSMNK